MMTASDRIDPPDDDPTTIGFWQAQTLQYKTENAELRAKVAAIEADKAAALARELDITNPDRNYQVISEAIALVRVNDEPLKGDAFAIYKKVQKLCVTERVRSYVHDDKGHRKVCANDLDDFFNKTGRHG